MVETLFEYINTLPLHRPPASYPAQTEPLSELGVYHFLRHHGFAVRAALQTPDATAQLGEVAHWSERLGGVAWLRPYLPALTAVRGELAYWLAHRRASGPPDPSSRRAWQSCWADFRGGRLPLWRVLQTAISQRDEAALYHLWAFFATAERIGAGLGLSRAAWGWQVDEVGLAGRLHFGETGYTLTYQEQFNRARRRSYSLPLQPRLTLHGPSGPVIGFDTALTAEPDALYRLHTYRDALHCRAALLLHPGPEERFYHIDFRSPTRLDWAALLRQAWRGVGLASLPKPEGEQ